jgi:hypothetical protein
VVVARAGAGAGADAVSAPRRWLVLGPALAGVGWLAGCAVRQPQAPAAAAPVPIPGAPTAPAMPGAPATPPAAPPAAAPGAPAPPPLLPLPPPVAARSWEEFQLQAARRIVAANAGRVYTGPVPEPLLAIPVLEVELNADGGVRAIKVLRTPTQARDTIELAKAAIHRAAPFGAMSRLSRPWKFVEVFLFDDERRFKPRTLDR